eukprot:TRINITY_DN600_c0_g1_i1.p1 TRINITY_DN600_c0_g1~~TRINITY_DN600_c0_g1_i1.p1  ORF type:complete len:546 (+),score=148.04 TRINITY_DN600_c0_g1_i1:77-1714(+)
MRSVPLTGRREGMVVVGVFSFALESNCFNPEPRRLSSFQHLQGAAYAADERQAGFVRRLQASAPALFANVDVRFGVLYRGWCGGAVPEEDFAAMKRAAAEGCRGLVGGGEALGGVYFDLHGAMSAVGCDDAEAELVEAVRGAVPHVGLAAASFDLHGNVSERLCAALDIVAAYKTFPHDDMEETKTKALRMLLASLQSGLQPAVFPVTIPAILPGDTVVTTEGHGRALYRWLRDLEPPEWRTPELVALLGPVDDGVTPVPGLMDASFFVGHGHADEPRVGAAAVVTGRAADADALKELARALAQWFWDRRALFTYPTGSPLMSWDKAEVEVRRCLAAGTRVLLGDLGDNANAGATGSVPFVCRRLMDLVASAPAGRRPRIMIAGLADRAAVQACAAAVQEGRETLPRLRIGAGHGYGDGCDPLELRGVKVLGVVNGGAWAVVEAVPGVTVVLQEAAWAFFTAGDVARLTDAFHPGGYDVVVVKRGNVESLEDLMQPRGGVTQRMVCLMANTPGGNTYPMPPRPRLRPGMYPDVPDRIWSAGAASS